MMPTLVARAKISSMPKRDLDLAVEKKKNDPKLNAALIMPSQIQRQDPEGLHHFPVAASQSKTQARLVNQ